MLSINDAWAKLLPHLQPTQSAPVPLESCCGRVLSNDLLATLDVPPSDVSAMDGFALPANLLAEGAATASASIAPTIAAGDAPGTTLADLQRAYDGPTVPRIMTGAPVPSDCDRVIPVELASVDADGSNVQFDAHNLGKAGQHIRRHGEVSRAGEPLLRAGQRLSAAACSLLATHGHTEVAVWSNPTVAYTTTGSEIVAPDQRPGPGQIRDSHSAFFASALAGLGIHGHSLGIAPDTKEQLKAILERGLQRQVLLVSGGVSMGEFDLVEDVLGGMGCSLLFSAVAIQPGKPMVAAVHKGGLVFGLPGNPASAQVTYRLFVEPALRRLRGEAAAPWSEALTATLRGKLPGARGRDRFLPCSIERSRDEQGHVQLTATPRTPQGSHDVVAYGTVNGLVRITHDQGPRAAGDLCSVVFTS